MAPDWASILFWNVFGLYKDTGNVVRTKRFKGEYSGGFHIAENSQHSLAGCWKSVEVLMYGTKLRIVSIYRTQHISCTAMRPDLDQLCKDQQSIIIGGDLNARVGKRGFENPHETWPALDTKEDCEGTRRFGTNRA